MNLKYAYVTLNSDWYPGLITIFGSATIYFLGYMTIQPKLVAHPEANEQVLSPGLEIPRNTKISMNTSVILDDQILDDPILDDNTPILQPTSKFVARSMQKIKYIGNWLLVYTPPKPKVAHDALVSFKNLITNCTTREALHSNWRSQNMRWKSLRYSTEYMKKMGEILIYFWLTPSSLLQTFRIRDDSLK